MQIILKYLKNHQLLQFAIIGGLIFLLYHFSGSSTQSEIVVTQSTIYDLLDVKSQIAGHELNEEEKQEIINNYVDEEVLLQEAYKQGLDRNDSKIRVRLIDKMRFLMSKELEEPTEDTLITFYNNHKDLYLKPEYITFYQVYFKEKTKTPNKNEFLNQLEKVENFNVLGDGLWLGSHLKGYAHTDLKIIFGEGFTTELFNTEVGGWSGPISSQHGSHFVQILEKIASEVYSYNHVKSYVREDWSVFQSQSTLENQMRNLKKGYNIRILGNTNEND